MIVIGIDPSINSTGVCIKKDDEILYYIIPSKMTKKMKLFNNKYIKILPYDKHDVSGQDYINKEVTKTYNIYNICKVIEILIKKYKPDLINMEGVAYSSNGSVIDLAGLNYCIRMTSMKHNIPFQIISPTSVKKFAVANGQAPKEVIIDAWKKLDGNIKDIKYIKIDDLADAYFIANYQNLET